MKEGTASRVFLALLLCLMMGVSALFVEPSVSLANTGGPALEVAAEVTDFAVTGTWGTCAWRIDDEGTVTVSAGVGADTNGKSPWRHLSRMARTLKRNIVQACPRSRITINTPEHGSALVGPNPIRRTS